MSKRTWIAVLSVLLVLSVYCLVNWQSAHAQAAAGGPGRYQFQIVVGQQRGRLWVGTETYAFDTETGVLYKLHGLVVQDMKWVPASPPIK